MSDYTEYKFENALVFGNPPCDCLKINGKDASVILDTSPHDDERGCEGVCPHGNSFVVVPAYGDAPFVGKRGDEKRNRIWVNP